MTLQSLEGILFFAAVYLIYWGLPFRWKNLFLLAASYFFYGLIDITFLLILIAQTLVAYYAAICLRRYPEYHTPVLIISVSVCVGILGLFKYYNFFIANVNTLLMHFGLPKSLSTLKIILPIGISFYTFQNISYIVDVKRKVSEPCENLISYCLFTGFFPKIFAGPIERASTFLSQIEKSRSTTFEQLLNGLLLLLWGFFQKTVIADNIAVISNKIFLLKDPGFFILSAGAFAYTIQIFADFSGYTDIARGMARLLGFELQKNFNNPYFASSPSDFWRRWHITLSQWIRDYIYFPLGGSRVKVVRWWINLFIAFFITGLWHGASWNFIIWGLYYWVLYLVYQLWNTITPRSLIESKYHSFIAIPFMFFLTNLGWLIFRETDLTVLLNFFTVSAFDWTPAQIIPSLYVVVYVSVYFLPLLALCGYTYYLETKGKKLAVHNVKFLKTASIPILLYFILLLKCDQGTQFIYYNF